MSKVIEKIQCPTCLDTGQDNLAVYEDGGTWCFGCNTGNVKTNVKANVKAIDSDNTFISGTIEEITTRRLSKDTCKFFGYQVGKDVNTWVQIANYYDQNGDILAQKLRTEDKKMYWKGDTKNIPLYGQWLWSPNEKLFVTIVEGEIDALTLAQVQGYQYPVVSIPSGASGAAKAIRENLKWLLGFKYVVLAFDGDDAGNKATKECLPLFEPGRVRVCTWACKDANEMLLNGRSREIAQCIFSAKVIKPENIVTVEDLWDKILSRPSMGKSWPWPSMTEITYGRQADIIIIVGATGIGKTEIVTSIIETTLKQEENIGLFSFEQKPQSTVLRLIGKTLGLKLHLPGAKWDEERIKKIGEEYNQKIFLYDQPATASLNEIFNSIRYLAKAKNTKTFIIDNLKGLKVSRDHERAEELMLTLQQLRDELGITIILLSHVAKDKYQFQTYVSTSPKNVDTYNSQTAEDVGELINKPGLSWESGRMPTKENVEGLSIVCDLADYVFALARNTVSQEYEESHTTRVKALKCRLDSSTTGRTFKLFYENSGILSERGYTKGNNSVI